VCVAVAVFNQMSTPVVPCSVGRDDVAALNQQQRQRQQQQPVAHFFVNLKSVSNALLSLCLTLEPEFDIDL